MSSNPFFEVFPPPFEAPPFDRIQHAHFLPAFEAGMEKQRQEVAAIVASTAAASFSNTFEALEDSGRLLARVSSAFGSLLSAHTDEKLQELARDIVPRLSGHRDDILMDGALFARVDEVYRRRQELTLDTEAQTLLEQTYRMFVRGGAHLDAEQKATLREINEELSVLSLAFRDNLLAETNDFELLLSDEAELAGLPQDLRRAAAETATLRNHGGKWVFTLHGPSFVPFLKHSERRDLRQRIYEAYLARCDRGNAHDNKKNVVRIAALRARHAQLLGYPSHAHYRLEDSMAETPQRVYDLLDQLWPKALQRARREAEEMQAIIDAEGGGFQLEAWDWWFYAERLRRQKFDLDEDALRPYFSLDNARQGAFEVASRLFGVRFEPRPEVPTYHPDVEVFEALDADDSHVGLFYTDFYARDSKRVGAWMNAFRKQGWHEGVDVRPLISNVCNFPRPEKGKAVLLRLEEVNTLFHEFGHALHGLLSRCRYRSLSGTSVPRDFVEVPSQIMENWAFEPEVMARYARHHETGEVMPRQLMDKITRSAQFNQGFATVEYLAASFLDLDWHVLEDDKERDPDAMERRTAERLGLPPQIAFRYRTPYFAHSFATGYSASYYSYIWAEVLDADGFHAFKEKGDLFDPELARSWRQNVLEKGYSEAPMTLFKRFRGREPQIDALLQRRGLA